MDRGVRLLLGRSRPSYPGLQPPVDTVRLCEDDLTYLTDIAPALIAYAAKS